jgi:glycosyltransferase involved in cell wall biosynthesis
MAGDAISPGVMRTDSTGGARSVVAEQSAAPRICVGHLIHSVAHGGPDTIVLNWIRGLDRRRFQPFLVCFADADTGREREFVDSARAAGLEVHLIGWNRRKPFLRAARELAEFVRRNRIEVLHCYNTYADITGVLVKWMTGVRIITTIWVWGHPGWKRRILQLAERMFLPFFDVVSAQSEDARRATVQPGVPLERIELLICGYSERLIELPDDERRARRREYGAEPDDVVLINLARFWPEKAHEVLLEAFRRIRRTCPQAILWLVGGGPDLAKMENLARALGVAERTRFFGFRRDLPELLALADIQVHPSHTEGLPLAVCAGMAAGKPIVATRVGGVPEVIHHGRTGILVPPGDPEAVARAVSTLIEDANQRNRLGREALRFIREEYSLEVAVERLERIYQRMAAR